MSPRALFRSASTGRLHSSSARSRLFFPFVAKTVENSTPVSGGGTSRSWERGAASRASSVRVAHLAAGTRSHLYADCGV